MKTYNLKFEQFIDLPIEDVFNFFSKPENLSLITPPRLKFDILTPTPLQMKEGQLIEYTIRIFGKKIRWTTLITEYTPNKMFIDQQLSGPYSMWHHTHNFKKLNDNETLIEDIVVYSVPYSFIGGLIHSLYIKRDLEKIFSYRSKKIKEIFNS